MAELTRRGAVTTLGMGAVAMTTSPLSAAQVTVSKIAPAFAGRHQPKALRFDPDKLVGLSERLIRSHWENNYGGSVKALNAVETRLATALADSELPAFVYGGLKREELLRTGSVVLHEVYFEGLGGNGQAAGSIRDALTATFGSFGTWEADFRRTAMSLAGGSGWSVLTWNMHTGELRNHWAWDHMHGAIAGVPLLALDMYEHAFHMDYGAAAGKYVDAFFRNVDWEVVDRRFRSARQLTSA